MLHWIWVLIVGGVIGLIAGAITHKGGSMNWIANIMAGLVGSSLGEALLGAWGPQVAGMAIVPSLLGAIILVILVSWIMTMLFGPRANE
ncbi:GlsB/YeaQ/YmgE family stress response membrane protein [Lactobacillus gasseri]|uniref:Transglycosylase associated protein n=1 Tax=Lactobacillus gasseri TaxID=1596 RepID=A0AB33ZWF1_LACGS|nr:GlsB/YeaQ/YmgE family stress response membrane protein [Lactobacillus gasseri]GBA96530.1 transglycosylase associated protein [Lactobacillus gasseri]